LLNTIFNPNFILISELNLVVFGKKIENSSPPVLPNISVDLMLDLTVSAKKLF